MATRRDFDARVAALMLIADQEDDERLRKVLELIQKANDALLQRLLSAGNFEAAMLPYLRQDIEQVLTELERKVVDEVVDASTKIIQSSSRIITEPLALLRIDTTFPTIPRVLLETYENFTTNLITGITAEARSAITREVGLVAVGAKKRIDAIEAIGTNLKDKSIFSSIAHRAEVIVDTETKRLRAQAKHLRNTQAAERVPNMTHWWLTSRDRRVRATHKLAGMHYPKSRAIPVGDTFIVGGHRCKYPRDITLPAKESVRCRCEEMLKPPDTYFEEA